MHCGVCKSRNADTDRRQSRGTIVTRSLLPLSGVTSSYPRGLSEAPQNPSLNFWAGGYIGGVTGHPETMCPRMNALGP